MAEQVEPVCSNYLPDKEFPTFCDIDYTQAYCCNPATSGDSFAVCDPEANLCVVGPVGCHMVFPPLNNEGQPMYKTALNATTRSSWVKIAFQQYIDGDENPYNTWQTILTMGNNSQPYNEEGCMATIKGFQYGWGTLNQGNRCRITILDQKGSTFQQWVERMGINPEGDSSPIQGKYRMKVQFGWYLTGGGDADICGQPTQPLFQGVTASGVLPITQPQPGFNSAFIICSPVMYFITDWINVHFDQGKFIYELEGVDTLVRGQEQMIDKIFGRDGRQIYFTKAVELLGRFSMPPFRPEFKAIDATGNVVPLQFYPDLPETKILPEDEADCDGYGPFRVWHTNQMSPLAIIHEWLKTVVARDQTGKIPSGKTNITMNFDPTYKFDVNNPDNPNCATCTSTQPQYGRLLLWANGIPYCQDNFNDSQINSRMKAVYTVNGGNCSPVLHFAPAFRWHSQAAMRAGGVSVPVGGNTNVNQSSGFVKANCPIASSRGPVRELVGPPTPEAMKSNTPALRVQEANFHHVMTNLVIGAIEADLRVEGDPSDWLCSPASGYGKSVGIIFINPYFLFDKMDGNCPVWLAGDPDDPFTDFRSICNELLTSKGWFIMGADHQIKDGQYITTIKLRLLAPGAELLPSGSITRLGAWDGAPNGNAQPLPYGGQFGCLDKYLVGGAAAAWGSQINEEGQTVWVGGGTPCGDNYDLAPVPLPPN